MKRSIHFLSLSLILMIVGFSFTSCVKKDYDDPITANVDPSNLTANKTIAAISATAPSSPTLIDSDFVFSGIVIADDKSGNFYKEMILEDSTGGISVALDISNFNTEYPIGRRVFVKCKGLFIAKDSDGNVQIGTNNAGTIGRIVSGLAPQYLVKGKWNIPVEPKVYSLAASNIPSNTLVRFNGVEFKSPDYNKPYANASTLTSVNRIVGDCNATPNTIKLYTSGYATFANSITPSGNGYIVGVYKIYRGAGELVIRNPDDVKMDSIRCDGSSGVLRTMPIDSVRMLFTGTTTFAPTNTKISGVVISDKVANNITSKNVVIQDESGSGIIVRFTASNTFNLGEKVEIDISSQEISAFNGLVQVNAVPNSNALSIGTGTVTPQVITLDELTNNYINYESELVTVTGVTITGTGTTYSGQKTLTDATGTFNLYTQSYALFSATDFPTGTVSITGIPTQGTFGAFTGTCLNIRNTTDVQ